MARVSPSSAPLPTGHQTKDFLPGEEDWRAVRLQARHATHYFGLPWNERPWQGQGGNWRGAGVGSSIDFHDHRPYLPGDDPRHINWSAYARSGHYSMKLYREEVSPRVDVAIDTSASMFWLEEKRQRVWELLHFMAESARHARASLQIYAIDGSAWKSWKPENLTLRDVPFPASRETSSGLPVLPDLARLPWRPSGMRILLSDLLFPAIPEDAFLPLTRPGGLSLVLIPFASEESHPTAIGNLEWREVETGAVQPLHITSPLRERYEEAYQNHRRWVAGLLRRHGIAHAFLSSSGSLVDCLRKEALPQRVVQAWA